MSAVVLTAAMVAEVTGGRIVTGPAGRTFDGVSIDSRSLVPGDLFIALRGPRFDGHDFVRDALARGAGGVIAAEGRDPAGSDAPVVVVRDTLDALQVLARTVRRRSGARVVAITGSTGKTTTKEITADLLAARYQVFRNRGNLNNHVGLPVSLLELRRGPDVAVVELGMNHEGEIRDLVRIAEPEVRVWTNVGDAHIGHFGSREAIARAKAEILEDATAATVVVANADDPLVMEHVGRSSVGRVTFGETAAATVRAEDVRDRGVDGTTARVVTPAGTLQLEVALPGRAQLANALAAVAVALELGVPSGAIENVVNRVEPVTRRGRVARLESGARLVDDSYNASPAAVLAMLTAVSATAVDGRRLVVLGEMLELGAATNALHEACGRAVASAGIDELVAIGGEAARHVADGAVTAGMTPARVHVFADSVTAAPVVAGLVGPGDLVLIKGSRGTATDVVADFLQGVA